MSRITLVLLIGLVAILLQGARAGEEEAPGKTDTIHIHTLLGDVGKSADVHFTLVYSRGHGDRFPASLADMDLGKVLSELQKRGYAAIKGAFSGTPVYHVFAREYAEQPGYLFDQKIPAFKFIGARRDAFASLEKMLEVRGYDMYFGLIGHKWSSSVSGDVEVNLQDVAVRELLTHLSYPQEDGGALWACAAPAEVEGRYRVRYSKEPKPMIKFTDLCELDGQPGISSKKEVEMVYTKQSGGSGPSQLAALMAMGWWRLHLGDATNRESRLSLSPGLSPRSATVLPGEPLPLTWWIDNPREEAIYVNGPHKAEVLVFLERKKQSGEGGMPVQGADWGSLADIVEDPLLLEGEEYLEPVYRLESGQRRAIVVDDALERFHGSLTPGEYTLFLYVRPIECFEPDAVLKRSSQEHEAWVRLSEKGFARIRENTLLPIDRYSCDVVVVSKDRP